MSWSGNLPSPVIGNVALESRWRVYPPATVTVGTKSSAACVRAARAPRTRAAAERTSRLAWMTSPISRSSVESPSARQYAD